MPSGTRSGTRACTSTIRCADRSRSSPPRPTTSGWPWACSTPAWSGAMPRWPIRWSPTPAPPGVTRSAPATSPTSRPRWRSGTARWATWRSCSSPTSRRATAACATSTCCGPSRPTRRCWPTTPTWRRSNRPPPSSPGCGSSSTGSPDASRTGCSSRTRTRSPPPWPSRMPTSSWPPSRRPGARSPGSATTCGAGAGCGTRRRRQAAPTAPASAATTRPRRPTPIPVGPDMVDIDGEIALLPTAPVSEDTSLAFRLAATAAELDRPIAKGSLHRLADRMPPPGDPWPPAVLRRPAAPAGRRAPGHRQDGVARPARAPGAAHPRVGRRPEQAAAQRLPHLYGRPASPRGRRIGGGAHRPGRATGPLADRRPAARHRQGLPGRPHDGGHGARAPHGDPHGIRSRRRRDPGGPGAPPSPPPRHRHPARPGRPDDGGQRRRGRRATGSRCICSAR